MLDVATQLSPPVAGLGYELFPIRRDPAIDRLIRVYETLSDRERQGFLSVLDATVTSLATDPHRLDPANPDDRQGFSSGGVCSEGDVRDAASS